MIGAYDGDSYWTMTWGNANGEGCGPAGECGAKPGDGESLDTFEDGDGVPLRGDGNGESPSAIEMGNGP